MHRHSFFSRPIRIVFLVLSAGFCEFTPQASADLFLDPSNGLTLISATVGDSDKDDGISLGSLALTGKYFGHDIVDRQTISINGNIYFGAGDGFGDYANTIFGLTNIKRISPMWADLKLGTGGEIIDEVTSNYYAVTWKNMELSGTFASPDTTGLTTSFQVIFFKSATEMNGLSFGAGDIVFTYEPVSFYTHVDNDEFSLMIGMQNSATEYATPPDSAFNFMGWYSPTLGDFPLAGNEAIVFRANEGDYNVSIEEFEAIPEPSTVAALVAGALLLGGRGYAKHRRQGGGNVARAVSQR